MRRWRRDPALVLAVAIVLTSCGGGDGRPGLRVSGSTTVNPVAADAAETLRKKGLRITVDSQGGSAGGLAQLAAGQIEVAMSSKPLTEGDRSMHPSVNFVTTEIGADAVGIVVRREVFDGGVRSLGREQLKALFEGRVQNWKQFGGPDLAVFVYDKEPGRGTREVLDRYLYGEAGKAPPPPRSQNYAIVGGNEEARTKLLSTPGSVGPLSTSFITEVPELAAVMVDGVEPSAQAVRDNVYPLARPLLLVTNGAPAGNAKTFVDFVISPEGQQVVRKHGFLTVSELQRR